MLGNSSDTFNGTFQTNNTKSFYENNDGEYYKVPNTGTYLIQCWGADGGDFKHVATWGGGPGAYCETKVELKKDAVLQVFIGQGGTNTTPNVNVSQTRYGTPLAVSNGTHLTYMRSGAGGYCAVKLLDNNYYVVIAGGGGGVLYNYSTGDVWNGGPGGDTRAVYAYLKNSTALTSSSGSYGGGPQEGVCSDYSVYAMSGGGAWVVKRYSEGTFGGGSYIGMGQGKALAGHSSDKPANGIAPTAQRGRDGCVIISEVLSASKNS